MLTETGNEHIKLSFLQRAIAGLLAVVLSFTLLSIAPIQTSFAYAATEATEAELTEAQAYIEQTAIAYDDAATKLADLEVAIANNEDKIAELENDLPDQQQKSDAATVALYKMQQENYNLINMVLDSESFSEVLEIIDYLNNLQQFNLDEITRLSNMKADLDETQSELEQSKLDAEKEKQNAEDALAKAQAAREEAQAKAEAEAAAQAAAEAAALAAAQAAEADASNASTEGTPAGGESSSGSGSSGGSGSSPNVDWSVDKQAFVNEWGGRIDRYLSGSPTAGYGRVYAEAAWTYGVDPRYSPAISYAESSRGAVCFAPYNAWGWMSGVTYTSWEESINVHVRGLSRGYSYTVTVEDAKKYASNWEHWYNTVSTQINLI